MKKVFFIAGIIIFFSAQSFAQHEEPEKFKSYSSLGLVISHTHVSEGVQDNGSKKWLALPSWALNYNFKFKPKWAIGLHIDMITENFEVEEHLNQSTNTTIERSYPITLAAMATFKPGKHFSFLLGAGGEFSKAGDLFLFRIGAEYSYEINEKWELNAMLTDDLKVKSYNSWSIGLGVTRIF